MVVPPTRWCKEFDDKCIHVDTMPQCDGRRDGQRDRRTELLKQYRAPNAMHADDARQNYFQP